MTNSSGNEGESTRDNHSEPSIDQQRIEELADQFLDALCSETAPLTAEIVARYPDLVPHLERRLRMVEMIFRASRRGNELSAGAAGFLRRGVSKRLSCPHCGGFIQIVGPDLREVICGSCGSVVPVDPEQTATDLMMSVPHQMGRYQLRRVLGQGSFGIVFLADDPQLGRPVAIKVPRSGFFADERDEQRFMREAKNAAQLRHPHIVQVHEISEHNRIPFIVSEFIEGLTLADRLTGPDFSCREAAHLMVQISSAVQYANEHGVIHRDLKPSNILLDTQNRPLITDFGLAKREDAEITMTVDGVVLGTPAYMSPEQAAGNQREVGPGSDVYSLGVILYRLLCHDLPFHGSKRMMLHQVLHDAPTPPSRLNRHVPPELETITLKAMAKLPAERYESAQAFADDLVRWLANEPIRARPISRSRRAWRWCQRNRLVASLAAAITCLLLASAVLGVIWAIQADRLRRVATGNAEQADQHRAKSVARLHQILLQNGERMLMQDDLAHSLFWFAQALEVADPPIHRTRVAMLLDRLPKLVLLWSPSLAADRLKFDGDGSSLIAGTTSGKVTVFDVRTGGQVAELATDPFFDLEVPASGAYVTTFGQQNYAVLWDRTNDRQTRLNHSDLVVAVDFSSDESMIATAGFDSMARLWNTADGQSKSERQFEGRRVVRVRFVDAQRLAVLCQNLEDLKSELLIWNFQDDEIVASGMTIDSNVLNIEWSEDRSQVALGNDRGQVRVWQAETGKLIGTPLENPVPLKIVRFDRAGSGLRTVDAQGELKYWLAAGDTWKLVSATSTHVVPVWADFSSEHNVLAMSTGQGTVRCFFAGSGAAAASRLTNGDHITAVRVAPDGRHVAVAGRNGVIHLWDLAGTTASARRLLPQSDVHQALWIADGRRCLTTGQSGLGQLWDSEDGTPIGPPLVQGGAILDCTVAPTGDLIATAGDNQKVKIWDALTGNQFGADLPHPATVVQVEFSNDGARLVTGCLDGTVTCWQIKPSIPASPQPIFVGKQTQKIRRVTWDPQGKLVAAASMDGTVRCWDVRSGSQAIGPFIHPEFASYCEFFPDGRHLLTCGAHGSAWVWKVHDGSRVLDLPCNGEVISAWIRGDGQQIITSETTGQARIWTVDDTTSRLTQVLQHPSLESAYHAQQSANGTMFLVAGGWNDVMSDGPTDGGVLLWEAAGTEGLVAPPLVQPGPALRAYFNPTETKILTAAADHTARVWDIPSLVRPIHLVQRLASLYSQTHLNQTGENRYLSAAEQQTLFTELKQSWPEMFASDPREIQMWIDEAARQQTRTPGRVDEPPAGSPSR